MRLATEIICEWLSVQSTVSAIATSVDMSQKSRGKMAAVTKKRKLVTLMYRCFTSEMKTTIFKLAECNENASKQKKTSNSQASAIADGPAQRSAFHKSCCTQRWRLTETNCMATKALWWSSPSNWVYSFVELSWQHTAMIDEPGRHFLKCRAWKWSTLIFEDAWISLKHNVG